MHYTLEMEKPDDKTQDSEAAQEDNLPDENIGGDDSLGDWIDRAKRAHELVHDCMRDFADELRAEEVKDELSSITTLQ